MSLLPKLPPFLTTQTPPPLRLALLVAAIYQHREDCQTEDNREAGRRGEIVRRSKRQVLSFDVRRQ